MINLNYGVILEGNVQHGGAFTLSGDFVSKTDLILSGSFIMSTVNKDYPTYAGSYTVIPTTQTITLNTQKKVLEQNVVVDPIPIGEAGTPTLTVGEVENNSVDVTPTVSNSSGYIDGGTITGNTRTISASDLVSGTLNIAQNGTEDVTNYKYVDVLVSGTATIEPLTVTENGVYTAEEGVAYSPVTVNVPQVDLSQDTVTPGDVLLGVTFHMADETQAVGTAVTATATVTGNTLYLTNGFPISV